MANKELSKAIQKHVKKTNLGGSQELTPGATGRRFDPIEGVNNLNKRIHRESKQIDAQGNLPFTFSKPKTAAKYKTVQCRECEYITRVSTRFLAGSISYECPNCKHWNRDAEDING